MQKWSTGHAEKRQLEAVDCPPGFHRTVTRLPRKRHTPAILLSVLEEFSFDNRVRILTLRGRTERYDAN
jgi:hypothetical protein